MKKQIYLLTIFFLILAVLISCDKGERLSEEMRADVPYSGDAIPIFEFGNIDCEDVILPEGLVRTDPWSTGRIDYLGNGVFNGDWSVWFEYVKVEDNKFVSFKLRDDVDYCVGAVIVKGGNGAMKYIYPSTIREDTGLSSPINTSGFPADLSNLTFCFVECDEELPELVIALKAYLTGGWLVTSDDGSQSNLYHMASFNYVYDTENKFDLYYLGNISSSVYDVGDITITNDEINLYVKIDYISIIISRAFTKTFLFVGPSADFIPGNYMSFPYIKPAGDLNVLFPVPLTTVNYTIPLSDF